MNKKLFLIGILALILIPVVSAQLLDSLKIALASLFDVTENTDLVWIKTAIWFIMFVMIFNSTNRILPQNRWFSSMLALAVSILGIRYLPEEYIEWMGSYIVAILLIGLPYFLGNFFGTFLRLGRTGKIFLIFIFYAVSIYAIIQIKSLPVGLSELEMLGPALELILEHEVITLIIIAIICILYISRGGVGLIRWGGREPGFWAGLRRGAGAGTAGAGNLFARFKRKRMMQAGWKRAEQKYEQKIKQGFKTGQFRGAKIKKGTQGYALLRQSQIRLAKARKRQGKKPGFRI